jgi:hypothetical protein
MGFPYKKTRDESGDRLVTLVVLPPVAVVDLMLCWPTISTIRINGVRPVESWKASVGERIFLIGVYETKKTDATSNG